MSAPAPPVGSTAATGFRTAFVAARRILVLSGVFGATYIVLGSCLFPDWWYGFFWDHRYNEFSYWEAGLQVLIDQHFILAICSLAAITVAVISASVLKHWLFPIIDRVPWLIVFCAVMAGTADALIVRHTQRHRYEAVKASFDMLRHSIDQGRRLAEPPEIKAPIHFYYVDADQVERLYNQIEPELEIREREVSGTQTKKAAAELGSEGAKLRAEVGKEDLTKSKYAPAQFLTERKCLLLMKYVRETWQANYFTTFVDWLVRQNTKGLSNLLQIIDPTQITSYPPLPKEEKLPDNPSDLLAGLKAELELLRGHAFVDGDFDVSGNGKNLVLTRRFIVKPFKCSFRVVFPKSVSEKLPNDRPLKVRVFGAVTKPLTADGFVDIAGVAVYPPED